jgi:hypothetical protein
VAMAISRTTTATPMMNMTKWKVRVPVATRNLMRYSSSRAGPMRPR